MKSQAEGKELVHIAANSIGESTMKLLEESLQKVKTRFQHLLRSTVSVMQIACVGDVCDALEFDAVYVLKMSTLCAAT